MSARRSLVLLTGFHLAVFFYLVAVSVAQWFVWEQPGLKRMPLASADPALLALLQAGSAMTLAGLWWIARYERVNRWIALARDGAAAPLVGSAAKRPERVVRQGHVLGVGVAFPPLFLVLVMLTPREGRVALTTAARQELQTAGQKVSRSILPVRRPSVRPAPEPHGDSRGETRLPVMELALPEVSRAALEAQLPRLPEGFNLEGGYSTLFLQNFRWSFTPAFFRYEGRLYPVSVRPRGWNFDHYLGAKTSWRIRFLKEEFFYGRREFNLVNQRDHSLVNDILWSWALRESGVLVPSQFLVHLRINDAFQGVQTFLEQPDEYFYERHNRGLAQMFGEERPVFTEADFLDRNNWQQHSHWDDQEDYESLFGLFQTLFAMGDADYPERIRSVLDVDQCLRYLAHGAINCQLNPSSHNMRWSLDPGVGRFQIVPWYQAPTTFTLEGYEALWRRRGWDFHPLLTAINDAADGLFRHAAFRKIFFRRLGEMLESTHHPDVLLQRVAALEALIEADALADSHMHYGALMERYVGNEEWRATLARMRRMIPDRIGYLARKLQGGPLRVAVLEQGGGLAGPAPSWLREGERVAARIEIVGTNHVAPILETLAFGLEAGGSRAHRSCVLVDPTRSREFRPEETDDRAGLTFAPGIELKQDFAARPIPLGTGLALTQLPRAVPAADFEFLGPKVKQAREYVPRPTTNTFFLIFRSMDGVPAFNGRIRASARNPVTRHPVAVEGAALSDGATFAEWKPGYSKEAGEMLCPEPMPCATRVSQTLDFLRPDGVHLGEPPAEAERKERIVPAGIMEVDETLHVPWNETLRVEAGAELRFAEGASLMVRGRLIAEGEPGRPIRFTSARSDAYRGAVVLNSGLQWTNRLRHCVFERGSNAVVDGIPFSAALAAYNAPCVLHNCVFQDNVSDDAFNSKYVSPTISGCRFEGNLDAIDIDFGGGVVTNSLFRNNRDDCIDLSSSWATVAGNRIISGGDKGVSVGEKSRPIIFNNHISGAVSGIAVKDLSDAVILNNTLVNNRTGVALYQKKSSFGPARATLVNNLLCGNLRDLRTDEGSTYSARFNAAETTLAGEGNVLAGDDPAGAAARLVRSGSGDPMSGHGLEGSTRLRRIGASLDF